MTDTEPPALTAFTFHVAGQLWAHADITIAAPTEEIAEQRLCAQLNLRDSGIINDLREQASEQIRKEMSDADFDLELTETRPADDDDEQYLIDEDK